MVAHNRGYYREQRRKHINRKKRIIHELNDYWYYEHEGELNKGKIYCNCPMCQTKTNNKHRKVWYQPAHMWKHSDLQKIESMDAREADYEAHQSETAAIRSNEKTLSYLILGV